MGKYKYKLKEQPLDFKVGDTSTAMGTKTTVSDIDPETGAISWDVDYVPAFDSVFKEFDELRKAISSLDVKTDDEVIDDIAAKVKAEFNRYRTHIRKNYPDSYKRFASEDLEEMSTTSSGGATFTPGEGAQYATPKAFSKKKGDNSATKFMYKLGYTKVNEAEDKEYAREQFQQQRIHDFDQLSDRLKVTDKKLKQAKLATDKYYRENPKSYSVVFGTDMINDYLNDIDSLLSQD